MVSRVWVGLGAVLLAVVGLLLGWRIDQGGGDAGVLAALALLTLAAGCLLAASAGGEVTVRVTGGALFVGGLAVVVTHHQLWWWLPASWVTPVSWVAPVVSLVGVGFLLLAYGFRLAGLSGALGLLALVCFALTLLPYLGSEEKPVLRAFATALGAVALTAGVGAATAGRSGGGRRGATAVAGGLGAVVTVYTGFDSYPVYASSGHHVAVIGATIIGAAASVALGAVVSWPRAKDGRQWTEPGDGGVSGPGTVVPPMAPEQPGESASPVQAPAAPVRAHSAARPVATSAMPSVVADEPALTAASPAPAAGHASRAADRLQTASLAVGLLIGLITIAKELIAAFLALIG